MTFDERLLYTAYSGRYLLSKLILAFDTAESEDLLMA